MKTVTPSISDYKGKVMTWGEFKVWVDTEGVEDSDEIEFMKFFGNPDKVTRVIQNPGEIAFVSVV